MRRFVLAAVVALLVVSCSAAEGNPDGPTPTSPSRASGTPSSGSACTEPCYAEPEAVGRVRPKVASSVSGLAASVRNPGAYYVVSDEEGTSSVAVVNEDGSRVGAFDVDGMSARNAEALAVGPCDDGADDSCLFIGDIGNHVGLDDLFVYRVREPDLTQAPDALPADVWQYTYPGKPTDAEALIVTDAGAPIVISKAQVDETTGESRATQVFRGQAGGGELEKVGEFDLPEPETGVLAQFVGNVVTGADSAEGLVILRTYDEVLEYRSEDTDTDPATFFDWDMHRVPAPNHLQSEAVAYRVEGCGYLTAAELDGDLAAVDCLR